MNTTHQSVGPFLTKRKVYFFGVLLPVLFPVAGVGLVFYLPWLAVHCWRARRRATRDLILATWKIPFQVAALAFVETLIFWCGARVWEERAGYWHAEEWTPLPSEALLTFTGGTLALGLVYLLVGWALLWATAKWPLDAKDPSPHLFMRR